MTYPQHSSNSRNYEQKHARVDKYTLCEIQDVGRVQSLSAIPLLALRKCGPRGEGSPARRNIMESRWGGSLATP